MPPKSLSSKPHISEAVKTPKIRSSCKTCADSKIGCTKERPTCSRCERRDVPCIYMATKRAGRPAKNKQRQNTPPTKGDSGINNSSSSAPPNSASGCPSSQSSNAGWPNDMADTSGIFTPVPSVSQPTFDWSFPVNTAFFDDMSPPVVDNDDLLSSLPTLAQPLSQVLDASPLNLLDDNRTFNWDSFLFQPPTGDNVDGMALCSKDTDPIQNTSSMNLTSGDVNNETPVARSSQRIAATPAESIDWFAVTNAANNGSAMTPDISAFKDCSLPSPQLFLNKHSSRGCLTRSLSLLDQLASRWKSASCTQDTERSSGPTSSSFESIMAQNQAALDTVDQILDCPCSCNSMLLITLALAVFKMLEWYTACANAAPRALKGKELDGSDSTIPTSPPERRQSIVRRPLQSTMQDYDMDIDYEDRIVCQIVLSRLYSVRRTLNILTQRLTAAEEGRGASSSSIKPLSTCTENSLLEGPASSSSSPSNLGQCLATNLKSHLHGLCESILRTLSGT